MTLNILSCHWLSTHANHSVFPHSLTLSPHISRSKYEKWEGLASMWCLFEGCHGHMLDRGQQSSVSLMVDAHGLTEPAALFGLMDGDGSLGPYPAFRPIWSKMDAMAERCWHVFLNLGHPSAVDGHATPEPLLQNDSSSYQSMMYVLQLLNLPKESPGSMNSLPHKSAALWIHFGRRLKSCPKKG